MRRPTISTPTALSRSLDGPSRGHPGNKPSGDIVVSRMARTFSNLVVLTACVVAVHARDLWQAVNADGRQSARDGSEAEHVILVVADGLRWQEVFRGADSLLMFGDPRVVGGNAGAVRGRYWRPTLLERRAALMPFLWSTVAREGLLFGNRDVGSSARVTNAMKFSYPGYNEMLVGYPDPRIDRNEFGPNPNVTVFEWLNRRRDFRGHVDVVGTWRVFADIFNASRSGLPVRANDSDAATHATAMRLFKERLPRALFVGYGETDDWAHKGRYDRTLDAAHAVDRYLADLWSAVQAMPRYRGRTTLIVVADHGRGRTSRDWTDHGKDVAGSEEMWLAVIGPRTPALGERRGVAAVALSQTAATVAAAVGLEYGREVRRAAPAIGGAVRR
jgi:hypothetical protein